jgi:hypothetical protein
MWAAALLAASAPGPVVAPEEDDVLRFRRTPTVPFDWLRRNDHEGRRHHRDSAHPKVQAADRKRQMRAAKRIATAGHTQHCAARQVWGDGTCDCGVTP